MLSKNRPLGCGVLIGVLVFSTHFKVYGLSLEQCLSTAMANDPVIQGSLLQERKLEALSVQESRLPDPLLTLGMSNLPVDTFALNQEPMTQLSLGISQRFSRGDTRPLTQQKWQDLAGAEVFARQNRRAELELTITHLWLGIYQLEKNIAIIGQDRSLFENMVDIVQSRYSTASGNTRQQDLVRAQLELTRLDDRLITYRLESEVLQAQLLEWLGTKQRNLDLSTFKNNSIPQLDNRLYAGVVTNRSALEQALLKHPEIARIEKQLDASDTALSIAKESYKPQWQLHASYGVRQDSEPGMEQADFVSIGVSMDLPFWTATQQDKKVQVAALEKETVKTHRQRMLNQLYSGFYQADAAYKRLTQRYNLYQQRLLKEIHEQAEASLSAYTSDDGDFSEVIRARIAELNANLDRLAIEVAMKKELATINYFLAGIEKPKTINHFNPNGGVIKVLSVNTAEVE